VRLAGLERLNRLGIALCATAISVSVASAGNNAGATARLSWLQNMNVEMQPVPETSPFSLFLRIENATDIQGIGVHLKWIPYADSTSPGYDVVRDVEDAACGWSSSTPPSEYLFGDTTYTGTIQFPDTTDLTCIEYTIIPPDVDTLPPAKFSLYEVLVQDSNGAIDTLYVTSSAKLIGANGDTLVARAPIHESDGALESSIVSFAAAPNPAVGMTSLTLVLSRSELVEFGVFDVAGRLVWSKPRESLPAGRTVVRWPLTGRGGQRLSPGIYFARIGAASDSRTVPVVISR